MPSTSSTLTAERLRELLDYDPETGVFTRLVTIHNHKGQAGDVAGSLDRAGYIRIGVDGRTYSASRLACLWMTGSWPVGPVRNENGHTTDNRWANLVVGGHQQGYCVYTHATVTGSVFYVGSGGVERALGNGCRGGARMREVWWNTAQGGYYVSILHRNLPLPDARRLEEQLIRRLTGEGIKLCNTVWTRPQTVRTRSLLSVLRRLSNVRAMSDADHAKSPYTRLAPRVLEERVDFDLVRVSLVAEQSLLTDEYTPDDVVRRVLCR